MLKKIAFQAERLKLKKLVSCLTLSLAILASSASTSWASLLYATINTGEVWTFDVSLLTPTDIFNSQKVFVTGQNNPNGIAFNSAGNAYIVNSNSNEIRVYDRNGGFVKTIGDSNTLVGPSDLAFDSKGNLYVTSTNGDDDKKIVKFDAAGNFVKFIASPGIGYGAPNGVTIDAFDNVFVTFASETAIARYTNDVVNGIQFDVFAAQDLTIDASGDLLATKAIFGPGNDGIYRFDTSTFPSTEIGFYTPGAPWLLDPLGIVTSPDGSMFVANTALLEDVSRITKLDASGQPVLQFFVGSPEFPRFLAFSPPGSVPVPQTALLLVAGLGVLGVSRRRRTASR